MMEVVELSVHELLPDPDNPNVEDPPTFNALVEAIREDGILEPLVVKPVEGGYVIVAGEHRWKAAKLAGLERVPCVIAPDWDEDERKVRMIRMNAIRGRFDPEAFTRLWLRLREKYGEEALKRMTGFANRETDLKRALKQVKSALPKQMRKELAEREDKIDTVQDLAAVVQSLWAKYGGTIAHHFVLFAWGGRVHLMVRCETQDRWLPMQQLAEWCTLHEADLDFHLATAVARYLRDVLGVREVEGATVAEPS